MGAWSHESFGNDDASDWIAQLEEWDDLGLVESALDAVLAIGDDYLEAPEASEGIAAAEVVARLRGQRGDSDADAADAWVEKVGLQAPPALIAKARRALDRILTEPSELMELWDESEDAAAWRASVEDLKARLG
jgi:hypothetical protein